jgi:hypothetical protein
VLQLAIAESDEALKGVPTGLWILGGSDTVAY